MKSENISSHSTYQTRINIDDDQEMVLSKMADHLSRVERHLYADYRKGKKLTSLKSQYIKVYQISGRQFNAIRISLEGKMDSILELGKTYIDDTQSQIKKLQKAIASKQRFIAKEQKKETPNKESIKRSRLIIHQKKQKIHRKTLKIEKLIAQQKSKKPSLCFGSKRLFNAQHHLIDNGYDNHSQWLSDWQSKRASQFFVLGSKDETSGCQSCVATLNDEGTINLRVLIPEALRQSKQNKYLLLANVHFQYGQEAITEALIENFSRPEFIRQSKEKVKYRNQVLTEHRLAGPPESLSRIRPQVIYPGRALSYRFLKDTKGWRVFVSLEQQKQSTITSTTSDGVLGIDINEHHLAVTEINRHGNFIKTQNIPCSTYGKNTEQAKAIIGDACKMITQWAVEVQKPIVIEQLNFAQKKQQLDKEMGRYKRMLSSLSYNKIKQTLRSQLFRNGVALYSVNPAYSSLIGRFKFAKQFNLSVHGAAALVIARRYYRFNEIMPACLLTDIKGVHVTSVAPVKDASKNVWAHWAKLQRIYKQAVREAHVRKLPQLSKSVECSHSF